MTDKRHTVSWHLQSKMPWQNIVGDFLWLYGKEGNELLLHRLSNIHVAPETQEQLDRVTHWAHGPNPHEDEIYLPYPPKEYT